MKEKFYDVIGRLSFFQLVSIFLIVIGIIGIIGYVGYKFYYNAINDEITKHKIKKNANNTYHYLKKNNLVNTESLPVKFLDTTIFTKEEENSLQIIKDKYSSYIDDNFFITSKLDKLKKINSQKNENLLTKKIGLKVLNNYFCKPLFTNTFGYSEDGCLLFLNDENNNYLYLDFYTDINNGSNKGIGVIFLPFYKICYSANSFYKTEEEFLFHRKYLNTLINVAQLNGVYVFQIPEKIYNLEFDNENKEWIYKQNYNSVEEEEILSNEELYAKFLHKYITKIMEEDKYFRVFKDSYYVKPPKIYY